MHKQMHRHTDTQTHRHTDTDTQTHTHRHTDTQTHTHTYTHTHTQAQHLLCGGFGDESILAIAVLLATGIAHIHIKVLLEKRVRKLGTTVLALWCSRIGGHVLRS